MKASRLFLAPLVTLFLGCASTMPPSLPPPTTAQPSATPSEASAAPTPAATPATAETTPIVAEGAPGNAVTVAMLHALKGEKGNYFFSGASLRGALGMTALGAKGATLDELAKALAVDPDPAKNAAAAKAENQAWKSAAGKAELVIANRLWVDTAYSLDKTFLANADAGYGASAAPVDFVKASDPSRKTINRWVETTTKGKIKDLLPSGSITEQTRLVLTNAIYFKGTWTEAFPKAATKDDAFHADAGDVNVPTMHREGQMAYADTAKAKIVQLQYKNSDLAMLVVLPQRADQLGALEADFSREDLDTFTKGLSSHKVNLSLPKFTFSWGRSVKPELQGMGIATAFGDKADFSGIAPPTQERLAISDVFHKAFVLVDESGTEAAAATGVVMLPMITSVGDEAVQMKVDRPFLFFVRNTKTGDILFAGRVANPTG